MKSDLWMFCGNKKSRNQGRNKIQKNQQKKAENVKLGKTEQTCTSEQIIKNEFSAIFKIKYSTKLD